MARPKTCFALNELAGAGAFVAAQSFDVVVVGMEGWCNDRWSWDFRFGSHAIYPFFVDAA